MRSRSQLLIAFFSAMAVTLVAVTESERVVMSATVVAVEEAS